MRYLNETANDKSVIPDAEINYEKMFQKEKREEKKRIPSNNSSDSLFFSFFLSLL